MKVLRVWEKGFYKKFKALHSHIGKESQSIESEVQHILHDVKTRGDRALLEYTARFDKVTLSPNELQVSEKELEQAWGNLSPEEQQSFTLAKENIETFHRQQLSRSWIMTGPNGAVTGQVVVPLEKVGIYVPGGKASYPSSVLMNAIPARVAGVPEVTMVTPPAPDGINSYTLAAAKICEIKKIYRVGGAQAIAALAYGTATIPRVDKIVGPGNIYVTAAKKLVAGEVGIDMLAGPSEILIIADSSARPDFIAADLLSQSEHDEEAKSILITPSEALVSKVQEEIKSQLKNLPRQRILKTALNRHGWIIITETLMQSLEFANEIAPEHLLLAVEDPFSLLGEIRHAGSVFLGQFSPVAAGDYLAGPNHVLPT
ncbi:MAG: histidinol dehydrogenase, partial [Pseudomonadota bacterium]